MTRIFIRDNDRLTCDIQPAANGFDLVFTQDGEHHVEHFAQESQAKARRSCVEDDLRHAGWSVLDTKVSMAPVPAPTARDRRPSPAASDDESAR